ncbi:MAG: ParA family protein [Anaerolineales bacterium]|jgi:cellulose biosynthesis protein BcsQ
MTILAIYSNKGGVGKTVTAVNLSYLASCSGYKTLICDLDPQSSATFFFRIKPKFKAGPRGFAKGGKRIRRSIKGTDFDNLDLLPADFTHRNLDITFVRLRRSKQRLKRVLRPLENDYDLIILDCLPTINIIAENIFNASDFLLVPLTPTTLAVRTHRQFVKFSKDRGYNPVSILTFISMVNSFKRTDEEIVRGICEEFDGVLDNMIPYLSLVGKMGVERQPLPAFAPISAAAYCYRNLWNEVEGKIIQP